MFRRHLLLLGVAALTLPISRLARASQSILTARGWDHEDKLRVVLDLSGPVTFQTFELTAPPRVIIDLHNAKLIAALNDSSLLRGPIKAIRTNTATTETTRVVFELTHPVQSSSFLLLPESGKGHRLVIDFKKVLSPLVASSASAPTDQSAAPLPEKRAVDGERDIIVVIDAGHGGKDPGAVGGTGEQEKLVALAIAQTLAAKLNRRKGFKARLVRNDDIFVPLRKRVEIARKHNADMFISVHADAAPNRTASGASVFALSENGATSTMARWMADRENDADLSGSRQLLSLRDKDPMLAKVVLDMSMSSTIGSSLDLGKHVLDSVGQIAGVHQKRVEQAGFAVLKSPDIPSILVETGFMSNARDCKRLVDSRHQLKLAVAIQEGVERYFKGNPPPGTYLAAARDDNLA